VIPLSHRELALQLDLAADSPRRMAAQSRYINHHHDPTFDFAEPALIEFAP
jgi:hypothetical protein